MKRTLLACVLAVVAGCHDGLDDDPGADGDGPVIGLPPDGGFEFTASTVLTNFGTGDNHFPADFTTSPGFYMNAFEADLVVRAVRIRLEGRPFALGAADVDICLATIPPVNGGHGTRTGVEQLCIAQHKSDAAPEWPEPVIDLVLPGQGLLLHPGHHTICTAQGAVAGPVGTRTHFSTFSCTLELEAADVDDPVLPVQSIRAPYFDERFRAEVSSFTPHVNPTQAPRAVVGKLSYIAVESQEVVDCVDTRPAGGAWEQRCVDVDRSTTERSNSVIEPLEFPFAPDDQISGHCQIANPSGSFRNICAAYFFVTVPRSGDRFAPLPINDTIPAGGAYAFCHHAFADLYGFTDPDIEGNRDRCTLFLGGTLPP